VKKGGPKEPSYKAFVYDRWEPVAKKQTGQEKNLDTWIESMCLKLKIAIPEWPV